VAAGKWRCPPRRGQKQGDTTIDELHSLRARLQELEHENQDLRRRLQTESEARNALSETLGETQERMSLILDSIPLGVSLVAPDWTVLLVNKALSRMLGRPEEELVGRKCFTIFEGSEAPCLACPGSPAMHTGQVCEHHSRGRRGDGRPFSVRIHALPVHKDGQSAGFLEILEDMSEKEQTEHEKLLLAELIDNAQHVAVFKDPQLRYVSVNRAYLQLTGFKDINEVLGKTDAELFSAMSTPEQIQAYMDNDRRALALPRGETVTSEEDTMAPDGSLRTFLTKKFPVYGMQDELLGVATLTSEITQRKRVEAELLQANRQLKAFFENIPGHINVVDVDYTIISASRGLMDTFGIQSTEQLQGRKCYEAYQGRTGLCPQCCLPQAFAEDRMVVRYSSPEEEAITGKALKIYSAPIKDEEGAIIGGMEFVADISDLRALERQLIAARDAAEAASTAKSEFLANMSHEIRTPLNGVLGMLQLLGETELDPEQRECVDTASSASQSLLGVINDILDISKIEAGKMELTTEPFELAPLVDQVLETFSFQAREKGIELGSSTDPALPRAIHGDPGRLRQILFNLAGNAVKFTDRGHVRIHVWSLPHQSPDGRLQLLFCVEDTGMGIPAEQLNHVFEPFTQKDASYTRRFQGTGLGLTIVRKLTELMGGSVSIDSELDNGTNVYFTLYARPAAAVADFQREPAHKLERSMRILLAEDNRVNQLVATKLLQRMGHEVTAVESGRLALEVLAREPFDLVLMDIQMPDMDGLETTRQIRDDTSGAFSPDIPIVAMTAHSMKGDQDAFMEAGMNAYIAKPVDMEELASVLERIASKT